MRLSARGLRLRLTVDLLWIPTRLVCNLRQAPGGTRHHNFMLCVVLAVPACTLASGWHHHFYKTEKSITGRWAHNPIHPAVTTAGVLLCFVEKLTAPAEVLWLMPALRQNMFLLSGRGLFRQDALKFDITARVQRAKWRNIC